MNDKQRVHEPVLLDATLECLDPQPGERYLDVTAGYGGHAAPIMERTDGGEAVLVDRDPQAYTQLQKLFDNRATILNTDFVAAAKQLRDEQRRFDVVLADFGVSSPQLDIAERGFSIRADGPLDMRMDERQGLSAIDIVNDWPQDKLADLIYAWGEEPKSRQIAASIVDARPLQTTQQLRDIIEQAVSGPPKAKQRSVTRVFQAVRIAVNDELRQIEEALPMLVELLAPGGRIGIITFHSLEDRIVKRFISDQKAVLKLLTRPARMGETEDMRNKRARSAKLRVARKQKLSTK